MPALITTHIKARPHVIDALISNEPVSPVYGEADFNLIDPVPEGLSDVREWRRSHWGTGSNAYNTERVSPASLYFETAWSAPLMLLTALSGKFPEEKILVRVAGEDNMFPAGLFIFQNGIMIEDRKLQDRPTLQLNNWKWKVRARKFV